MPERDCYTLSQQPMLDALARRYDGLIAVGVAQAALDGVLSGLASRG
jgi:hypothetical protein